MWGKGRIAKPRTNRRTSVHEERQSDDFSCANYTTAAGQPNNLASGWNLTKSTRPLISKTVQFSHSWRTLLLDGTTSRKSSRASPRPQPAGIFRDNGEPLVLEDCSDDKKHRPQRRIDSELDCCSQLNGASGRDFYRQIEYRAKSNRRQHSALNGPKKALPIELLKA